MATHVSPEQCSVAIILSNGALLSLKQGGAFPLRGMPAVAGGVPIQLAYGSGSTATYERMFAQSAEVNSTISYLARSAAAVKLRVFRRDGDDRQRLYNHELARLLEEPMPSADYFSFAYRCFLDWLVYGELAIRKVRNGSGRIVALMPVNPSRVVVYGTDELPTAFEYTTVDGQVIGDLTRSDLVFAVQHNAASPLRGLSTLESLRQILSAETAAVQSRHSFFANGTRLGGVVTVDKETELTQIQKESFSRELAASFSGADKSGRVALLESGMQWHELSGASAKDSEYTESLKLSRTVCGAAYGVPADLIGGQPSKESLNWFLRETLVPLLTRWAGIITRSVLKDMDSSPDVYIRPNIDSKLNGAFLESADVLRRATGKPLMSVNTARQILDLPRDPNPESDRIPTPLFLGSEATSGGPDGGRLPIERPQSQ
ncbi:MAG: phage portal protein [Luteitalea sp.]|nr:phage portal protein [Luteitalea sp.]